MPWNNQNIHFIGAQTQLNQYSENINNTIYTRSLGLSTSATGEIYINKNASNLFNGCINLICDIFNLGLNWDKTQDFNHSFYNASKLYGNIIQPTNIRIFNMNSTFYNCSNLTGVFSLPSENIGNIDYTSTYYNCTNLSPSNIYIGSTGIESKIQMLNTFENLSNHNFIINNVINNEGNDCLKGFNYLNNGFLGANSKVMNGMFINTNNLNITISNFFKYNDYNQRNYRPNGYNDKIAKNLLEINFFSLTNNAENLNITIDNFYNISNVTNAAFNTNNGQWYPTALSTVLGNLYNSFENTRNSNFYLENIFSLDNIFQQASHTLYYTFRNSHNSNIFINNGTKIKNINNITSSFSCFGHSLNNSNFNIDNFIKIEDSNYYYLSSGGSFYAANNSNIYINNFLQGNNINEIRLDIGEGIRLLNNTNFYLDNLLIVNNVKYFTYLGLGNFGHSINNSNINISNLFKVSSNNELVSYQFYAYNFITGYGNTFENFQLDNIVKGISSNNINLNIYSGSFLSEWHYSNNNLNTNIKLQNLFTFEGNNINFGNNLIFQNFFYTNIWGDTSFYNRSKYQDLLIDNCFKLSSSSIAGNIDFSHLFNIYIGFLSNNYNIKLNKNIDNILSINSEIINLNIQDKLSYFYYNGYYNQNKNFLIDINTSINNLFYINGKDISIRSLGSDLLGSFQYQDSQASWKDNNGFAYNVNINENISFDHIYDITGQNVDFFKSGINIFGSGFQNRDQINNLFNYTRTVSGNSFYNITADNANIRLDFSGINNANNINSININVNSLISGNINNLHLYLNAYIPYINNTNNINQTLNLIPNDIPFNIYQGVNNIKIDYILTGSVVQNRKINVSNLNHIITDGNFGALYFSSPGSNTTMNFNNINNIDFYSNSLSFYSSSGLFWNFNNINSINWHPSTSTYSNYLNINYSNINTVNYLGYVNMQYTYMYTNNVNLINIIDNGQIASSGFYLYPNYTNIKANSGTIISSLFLNNSKNVNIIYENPVSGGITRIDNVNNSNNIYIKTYYLNYVMNISNSNNLHLEINNLYNQSHMWTYYNNCYNLNIWIGNPYQHSQGFYDSTGNVIIDNLWNQLLFSNFNNGHIQINNFGNGFLKQYFNMNNVVLDFYKTTYIFAQSQYSQLNININNVNNATIGLHYGQTHNASFSGSTINQAINAQNNEYKLGSNITYDLSNFYRMYGSGQSSTVFVSNIKINNLYNFFNLSNCYYNSHNILLKNITYTSDINLNGLIVGLSPAGTNAQKNMNLLIQNQDIFNKICTDTSIHPFGDEIGRNFKIMNTGVTTTAWTIDGQTVRANRVINVAYVRPNNSSFTLYANIIYVI